MEKREEKEKYMDKIRGSMIGGAAGDALGYVIEFVGEGEIFSKYGPEGITEYKLDRKTGKALISDDTQMALFTANGILVGETRLCLRGVGGDPLNYVPRAYKDWYLTQTKSYHDVKTKERYTEEGRISWLMDVPELFSRRAPGNTCLSALSERNVMLPDDWTKNPKNHSKGCGGIMRTAPLALHYQSGENCGVDLRWMDKEAAALAAITHGHSLGYMPSAVLNHVISRILTDGEWMSLKEIILEARDTVGEIFADDKHIQELKDIIDLAVRLSENADSDLENIHEIGEGWVAEETLGIALYCALKYQDDFSKALTVSVNHKGDSDSTGAVTGNIVGALIGYDAMDEKWKRNLELSDVILEMADDLCYGCSIGEYSPVSDPAWETKYEQMHRFTERKPVEKGTDYTFFWIDTEKNGQFSNWYRREFVIDDFRYFCVEQYMMSQKAKMFHDASSYTKILRADTAEECKAYGRKVCPFDPGKWDAVSYEIVKEGNRQKFKQNPDLKKMLLDTGNNILAEASPKDMVWGIGFTAKKAGAVNPDQWPGKNLLGKLLMELREEFRNE